MGEEAKRKEEEEKKKEEEEKKKEEEEKKKEAGATEWLSTEKINSDPSGELSTEKINSDPSEELSTEKINSDPGITESPATDATALGEVNLPPASPSQTQRLFLGSGVPVDPSDLEGALASADDSNSSDPVCPDDHASGVVEALGQAGASIYATALDESKVTSFESGIQTLLAPSDECARVASLSDCEWITRRMEGVAAANATELTLGAELTFTTRFWCKDQDNHGVVHVP